MEGIGDNLVQHVDEQIVQNVQEVTTTLSPVVSEVSTASLEPVVIHMEEVITEVSTTLVDEVTTQSFVDSESSTSAIIDHVSTIVENVVQPIVSEIPIESEIPQSVQEDPVFVQQETIVETISDRVNEFVTESTQELTTLLSSESDDVKVGQDSLIPKELLTRDYVQWLHETRLILAISVSMVYLFTIFLVRRLLTKRSPFHLRNLLTLWNLGLALFSIMCSVKLAGHLIPWTKENGLGSSICSPPINDALRFWLNLFTWSKLFELGNTLFVVLRKQQLRFVHIFYHLSTLVYAFHLFGGGIIPSEDISPPAYYPVIVLINVSVQGIIYTYYTFRSRGCAPIRLLTMTLNLIQIIQFITILFILSLSIYHHLSPSHQIISTLSSIPLPASLSKLTLPVSLTQLTSKCSPSISTDIFGIIVIGTNFILFVNHFRSNYVKPKTIKLL